MFEMREVIVERNFSGDGIFFEVGHGCSFFNLSPTVCCPGHME